MGKRRGLIGLASGISLALVGHATAKPATTKDLAGRTICYNNGEKATYFRAENTKAIRLEMERGALLPRAFRLALSILPVSSISNSSLTEHYHCPPTG